MSKLTDYFRISPTHEIKPVDNKINIYTQCIEVKSAPYTTSYKRKYKISLHLESFFWCEDEIFDKTKKQAEKMFLIKLHHDSRELIECCKMAIYEGEDQKAIDILNQLEKDLLGE